MSNVTTYTEMPIEDLRITNNKIKYSYKNQDYSILRNLPRYDESIMLEYFSNNKIFFIDNDVYHNKDKKITQITEPSYYEIPTLNTREQLSTLEYVKYDILCDEYVVIMNKKTKYVLNINEYNIIDIDCNYPVVSYRHGGPQYLHQVFPSGIIFEYLYNFIAPYRVEVIVFKRSLNCICKLIVYNQKCAIYKYIIRNRFTTDIYDFYDIRNVLVEMHNTHRLSATNNVQFLKSCSHILDLFKFPKLKYVHTYGIDKLDIMQDDKLLFVIKKSMTIDSYYIYGHIVYYME